jgi:chemotaxis methyl-accepting protein methylase/signal transduction histidine kinase/chemotaxis response regulator CheB
MIKETTLNNSSEIEDNFTIVAIGSSVGGLEAMSIFLKALPTNSGMAYIYVQHLDPNHKSQLVSILAKKTKMKVQEIENMEHIEPNNVYVIPNNKMIEVIDGHIRLIDRPKNSSFISIDFLFESLAQTHKKNVIGIILSGNASDGSKGIIAIKNAGGITFAQDDSAQAKSMPRSAITSGSVDYILNPKDIAKKIISLQNQHKKEKNSIVQKIKQINELELNQIFELLIQENGIDFSHYKLPTITRRIKHKISELGLINIQEYIFYLKENKKEIQELSNDLLINVTLFFRESNVFTYLKKVLFPKILNSKTKDEKIRIWVPACSTGEEAYSFAMILSELCESKFKNKNFQIFATDLSENCIKKARLGIYSLQEMKNIPKKYLTTYFTKLENNYQIKKEIRELVVFAPHNILQDPPFSKMDFVSCCNLLIYFDLAAQKKVFSTLHFALNENGFLLLGKAETVGSSSQLFSRFNPNYKIFSKKHQSKATKMSDLSSNFIKSNLLTKKPILSLKSSITSGINLENQLDKVLLNKYMPACVVINKDLEIQQFRGEIGIFLQHAQGKASLNILKMAHPEFVFELRSAIQEVLKNKERSKRENIEFQLENTLRFVMIEVSPLKIEWDEALLLIVFTFQEYALEKFELGKNSGSIKDKRILKLSEELQNTRLEMNVIIEKQESTFEELQAANEEIVSSNEEFQTLNEELETSKEEIEASNEELIIGNHELQVQNDLLNESYDYSEAIIATIHKPLLVLTKDFYVKSANQNFYDIFKVKKEETIDKLLFDLGNKQWNIIKLKDVLKELTSKNKNFENFEVVHTFSSIGKKTMQLHARKLIQKANNEHLLLLAIEDISIQKKIEFELNEAKQIAEVAQNNAEKHQEIAEVALNAKQQFLSNMSHEIRTPMNAIIGFTKVVLKTKLDDKQKEYLTAIKDSGDNLISLINDILDFAKVDAGKMVFEQAPFNVKNSLCSISHIFEGKIVEKNLQFIKNYDPKIPEVIVGDTNRLNQILINLLSNAIKFTSKGTITFEVKISKETKTSLELCFKVSDTGIGIQEDKLVSIFENFQQGSDDTSRLFGGTGLGLAIVKQLVESQGGKITVESKLNQGSSFSFKLSFAKVSQKEEADFAKKQIELIELDSEIKNVKILVAEDIALNQLLIKTILHDFGFELDIAANGKIALEMLQKNHYELILMDLHMPELNGFETTQYIRETLHSSIPIIALTADVTTVDLEKCNLVGMNDYVTKPIDEKILYEKIIKLIKKG